jgi:naphthalene 1,2-dioxygenase ferredoxin reductase component
MDFTVSIDGTDQSAPANGGDTVLDALLAANVGFSYSCQAGNCGTCKCELVSGEIFEMEYSEHALLPQERERGVVLACRSQVWSDVVVRRLQAEEFIVHPSRVLRCRVAALDWLTHDIVGLRLEIELGGPYSFSAGQYARIELAGAPDARDYSMANCPNEPLLEFHVRVLPEGQISRRVAALKIGDAVRVSGPLGTSYLRAMHPGPLLAIAGGSGLAPIRAIVESALECGVLHDMHVYFGARAARDVYGQQWFENWRSRGVQVHVVLSEKATGETPFRSGWVSDAVAEDFSDLSGFKVYLAGPPPMVDAAIAVLRARGVHPRDTHADSFYPARATAPMRSPRQASRL